MLPLLMWLLENLKYIWDTLLVYNVMLQNTSNNAWFIKTHTHRHQDEALDWNLTHPPTGLKSHTHTHTHTRMKHQNEISLSLSHRHTHSLTHTHTPRMKHWTETRVLALLLSNLPLDKPPRSSAHVCAYLHKERAVLAIFLLSFKMNRCWSQCAQPLSYDASQHSLMVPMILIISTS